MMSLDNIGKLMRGLEAFENRLKMEGDELWKLSRTHEQLSDAFLLHHSNLVDGICEYLELGKVVLKDAVLQGNQFLRTHVETGTGGGKRVDSNPLIRSGRMEGAVRAEAPPPPTRTGSVITSAPRSDQPGPSKTLVIGKQEPIQVPSTSAGGEKKTLTATTSKPHKEQLGTHTQSHSVAQRQVQVVSRTNSPQRNAQGSSGLATRTSRIRTTPPRQSAPRRMGRGTTFNPREAGMVDTEWDNEPAPRSVIVPQDKKIAFYNNDQGYILKPPTQIKQIQSPPQ